MCCLKLLVRGNLSACFSRDITGQCISFLCRKRILQGLMCGRPSDGTGCSVNELQEVEIKIESLQQEIKNLELRGEVSSND